MKKQISRKPHVPVESLEPLVLMSASSQTDGHVDGNVQIAFEFCEQLDGSDGDDTLIALVGENVLHGNDGNDELISARANNQLDGGNGQDTAVYWANREDFTFRRIADGVIEVRSGKRTDQLRNIELIRFDDGTYTVAELLSPPDYEYRSLDGSGNNIDRPELGSTDQMLLRLTSPEYENGAWSPAGEDRPGARYVSNQIVAESGPIENARGLTDIAWLWGQFLDHDIDLTEGQEPAEPFNIPVPEGDPHFDPFATGDSEIELNRSIYEPETGGDKDTPRQQINQITAFIDGSMIYGSDIERSTALRSFEGGQLRTSEGDLLPYNDAGLHNAGGDSADLFLAGDIRANENAALTAMHTLWVREHNRLAEEIAATTPGLTDEQIFQQAREIVIAQIQAITFNDFLPAILGEAAISEYQGYDADVDPGIANEFSTAAYRFGHTMLTSELLRLNNDGEVIDAGNLDLQKAFFAPQEVASHGIDSLLLGAASKAAAEVDTQIVDDVRNFLFGPPGAGGFDLASLNIQRGRDHGLADYNQVRAELGLEAFTDFSQITSDTDLQQKLEDVYGSVDNIDLWVGGLAEDHVEGSGMGETFRTILIDQFSRLRDGDRFWYENLFEGERLAEVDSVTLADVIERNSTVEGLQANVFFRDA